MNQWSQEILKRLAGLKLAPAREAEIAEEVAQHLEDRYQELVAGGATEEEARRAALEELSDEDLLARGLRRVEHETRQEPLVPGAAGRGNFLAAIWQDLRFGVRMLQKNPGFAAVVVITLGLGIGLNSGIFSLVSGFLIRKPPVEDPENLMTVMVSNPSKGAPQAPASAVEFAAWQVQNHVFESIGAGAFDDATVTGRLEPVRLLAGKVTLNYFELFGVPAALGRTFSPNETLAKQERNMVISFDLWQRRLGADPSIVGKPITLEGQSYTVMGVMPRQFRYAFFPCDVWVPVSFSAQALRPEERHNHSLNVFVRLRHGVGAAKAQTEVSTILQQVAQDDIEEKGWTAKVMTLQGFMVDKNTQTSVAFLMGMVGFVLLIACANVAGIYLARSTARQQEFAVRAALGARRARLVQQLLGESSVLALLGGGLGLLLASLFVQVVRAKLSFNDYAAWLSERIEVDHFVLLFTLIVSLLTVLLFALLPALQTSKPDIQAALKEGGRTASSGPRQSRMRSVFVVTQIIFTMVLMAGAGTMIQGILGEMMPHLGFNPEHVLTVDLSLPSQKYADPAKQIAFSSELVERSKGLPGVQFSAVAHGLPEGRLYGVQFEVEGQPAMKPEERPRAFLHVVSQDYFRTMAIPLLKGRSFAASETTAGPGVAIVNEAFVKRFYPKTDPLGEHVRVYKTDQGSPNLCELVGMVGNVKEHLGDSDDVLQMYVPFGQAPTNEMTLVLRTDPKRAPWASTVRGVVWAIDKDQPITWLKTMTQLIDEAGAGDRFMGEILAAFSAMALLLSGIGIYGVVSYLVAQRTHEIGLRMALGAGRREVLRLVVGKGAMLSGIGIIVGFLASYPIPRMLLSAYGESDTSIRNSLVLVIAPVLVTAVALLASYIPARRATNVDPMVALRYE